VDHAIRPATPGDRDAVLALLAGADLPTEDLAGRPLDGFFVAATPGGAVLAAVGLESLGNQGLLRSLVVEPDQRGRGLGRRLVLALEHEARVRGVDVLWLLTTTAAAFFAGMGYVPAARSDAPPFIAATSEFRDLCPATAAFLCKRLGAAAG
jgi:N-acetylglutamate synthase-like GNAT family acetyltransferase